MQVELLTELLIKLREETIDYVEVKPFAEAQWSKTCQDISDATVFTKANSWYVGSNIPGKKREQLNYIGGLPAYVEACRDGLKDWTNFEVKREDKTAKPMAKKDMPIVR